MNGGRRLVVSIVAAVAENGVIGADGAMPWRLPSDLKHFRRLTLGKPVVMGRKTLQSIGKPLDGRRNIVLTRDRDFRAEGVEVVHSLDDALALVAAEVEIVIGGGGELYREAIGRADRLHITEVAAAPSGDTRFPEVDLLSWERVAEEPMLRTERDSADARFVTYERRRG